MTENTRPHHAHRPTHGAPAHPDLTEYRAMHAALRRSNDRLVDAVVELRHAPNPARARAVRDWYRGYHDELVAHHRIEDTIFFPALAERVPTYAEHHPTLHDDHERLDDLVGLVAPALDRLAATGPTSDSDRDRAIEVVTALRDLMSSHLDFEDREVLPLFERHFDAEEYGDFQTQARRSVSLKKAFFFAPWLMASLEPAAAASLLQTAPLPLKLIHRAARRRYARLTALAFGIPASTNAGTPVR
ncbi:hemerythrin domain-containing protein [Ilumatobacter nonamiensis]|uniref:hemerythrin domain-containing protein n=1 Tax=Ilumatobacter nonamiensis TaxID=467093 RepID=UPI000349ADB8|nr:hemerythrin domain-containing protein [Ilumatobacter nonamiensis]